MFVGDVGRPDLAVSVRALRRMSSPGPCTTRFNEILLQLPDETLVYPAHGAGSACGKNISAELHSTIGTQREINPSVQPMSEDDFVCSITSGQPAVPGYFAVDAVLNRRDRTLMPSGAELAAHSPQQVRADLAAGVTVLDARAPEEFARQHLTGAINVGLDGRYAETAGMVLGEHESTVIITPSRRAVRPRCASAGSDLIRSSAMSKTPNSCSPNSRTW